MPDDWAASGARMAFSLDVEVSSDDASSKDNEVGRGACALRPLTEGEFVSGDGVQRVRVAELQNHALSPFCGSVGVRRPQTSRTCAMPPRTAKMRSAAALHAYRSGPRVASRPIERPSRGVESKKVPPW